MTIEVVRPGLLTTVQDRGRYGYQKYGIPPAGVMDLESYELANAFCGNTHGEAVLEMTVSGGEYIFHEHTWIALTGADMKPRINGERVPMYRTVEVQKGDHLVLKHAVNGCRTYMAVCGGIDTEPVMNSRSTHMKCHIGGLEGRKLKAGDVLPIGKANPIPAYCTIPARAGFYSSSIQVRVMMGPQDDMFTEKGKDTFLNSTYTVDAKSDRMGIRLEGEAIESIHGTDIVSDAAVFGSIQITGNGQPIVLMADRQTTGGYAKIATVITEDLSLLAQAAAGTAVQFIEYGKE